MDKTKVNYLIQKLANDISKNFSVKLKEVGLSYMEWNILKSIKTSTELITQKQLSEKYNIPKGTMSGMIKKLISKGYLQEMRNDKDKRENILLMSMKSNSLCTTLLNIENEFYDELFFDFKQEELMELERLINKIKL